MHEVVFITKSGYDARGRWHRPSDHEAIQRLTDGDPLASMRGLLYGVAFSAALWGALGVALWAMMR